MPAFFEDYTRRRFGSWAANLSQHAAGDFSATDTVLGPHTRLVREHINSGRLLIANHALVLAHAEDLPDGCLLIADEAHTLEDAATGSFVATFDMTALEIARGTSSAPDRRRPPRRVRQRHSRAPVAFPRLGRVPHDRGERHRSARRASPRRASAHDNTGQPVHRGVAGRTGAAARRLPAAGDHRHRQRRPRAARLVLRQHQHPSPVGRSTGRGCHRTADDDRGTRHPDRR